MPTSFPAALDSFLSPAPTDSQATVSHSTQHTHSNDALLALEKILVGNAFYNVKGYGAVGNGTTDDAAAIQAAIDACQAGGGGTVLFPHGIYKCLSELVYKPATNFLGSGSNNTILSWPTDLGSGKYGFKPNVATLSDPSLFENLSLQGPGPASITIGTRSVNMDGIRLWAHCRMSNCKVSQFGSGVVIMGDHQVLDNCTVSLNYFGVRFEPATGSWSTGSQTFSDQVFMYGGYTNNARAGFTADLGNFLDGVTFLRTHIGFQPFALWRDTQAHTTAFMASCRFIGTSFEDLGNGIVIDNNTGGATTCAGCEFQRITSGGLNAAVYRIGTESFDFFFNGPAIYSSKFTFGSGAAFTGAVRWFYTNSDPSTVIEGLLPTAADALWAGAGNPTVIYGSVRGFMELAAGTIAQGDLVAQGGSGVVRLTGANIASYIGVAMTDGANGKYLPIAPAGAGRLQVRSEACNRGDALRALAGTEHHATTAGGNPIVAIAAVTGGGAGGVLVQANLRSP